MDISSTGFVQGVTDPEVMEATACGEGMALRQQDVDSAVDERKKDIEEELSLLRSWRRRCSETLQAARRGHVTGGLELELRLLEFIEGELSFIFVHLNKALGSQHVDDELIAALWLEKLTKFPWTKLPRALMEADQRHNNTLLRRATQCFHRSRQTVVANLVGHHGG
ncbi:hypothetical protein HU200_005906 [Digitaria exilis]|uniref:Uncharacterized protein n=1 Tax=Digitaria exilis TaxID=1010633 RepID=A0A835FS06_9POAL|nr:hypothetical protein HU200_005906 [Digitaria exilis]